MVKRVIKPMGIILTLLIMISGIISEPQSVFALDSADNPKVTVIANGKIVDDPYAFIDNGRTFVGLRAVSEALGANVNWNDATRTVTLKKGETNLELRKEKQILCENLHFFVLSLF